LLSSKPDETRKAIYRFEDLENVLAVELGFEDDSSFDLVTRLIHAATGELPVIAQLPMQRALDLAEGALDAGASIVSLAPPRGALLAGNGKLVSGRLYGPAIFPQALEVVRQLTQAGYPVIGAGGVEENTQAAAILNAGALAVQMDLALWKGIVRNNIG
jgi:dihydroorotate dehydrogenase